MKLFLTFVILVLVIALDATSVPAQTDDTASATKVDQKSLDRGQLDGVVYTNNYFGLSLSVPLSWVIVSAPKREEITADAKKILSGDQKATEKIDESIQRSVTLLALTKFPAGQPKNASFMLIAERIPSSSVETGIDVINKMKDAFKGTNFNIEFLTEVKPTRVSGTDFGTVTVKNTSPNGTYFQRIYVTTRNGYALQLFYTYVEDGDHSGFESILNSVKLK